MGSAAKQMIKFKNEIRPGHIILVPSQNSERFSVGEVVGEVYSEEKEQKLLACPYVKRRKIKWIGKFNRFKADPLLQKVVYAAHTVSDITQYKSYINRATFDTSDSQKRSTVSLFICFVTCTYLSKVGEILE